MGASVGISAGQVRNRIAQPFMYTVYAQIYQAVIGSMAFVYLHMVLNDKAASPTCERKGC